ncbi:hypothetical protein HHK36_002028 [Tetracentron sinense]|uniref:non-specific serine/threonine protein kinase n=1 Tax=Tetracentron sinense TaxID=13715 RepID=A0A834ZTR2_TETSI|nr:hypothetical protein HHK36_002028 [Tetracentron sinense]
MYVDSKNNGKSVAVIVAVSAVSGLLLFVFISWRIADFRCDPDLRGLGLDLGLAHRVNKAYEHYTQETGEDELDLPLFDLETVVNATNNFSFAKKIGEGGFGIVYKGELSTGHEIAVKRLYQDSQQGLREFKNEVILIAKLQHRNLVRLLGCCIQREETMLIYEYMPNKSLDSFIFNQTRCSSLEWRKRFEIIVGIARGLLYLHRDSRLRIIHRDLKASNILLDGEMNPKISDFGIARMIGRDQTEANTKRVIGTYGYMSPEYAIDGLFSVKSDVFSFGVLVLEIVSGKKNRRFYHPDHDLNLLGHAWKLWNEEKPLELIDAFMEDPVPEFESLKCIQVGLLCVQKRPDDRPTMPTVLLMLDSENVVLPQPKQPGFYTERFPVEKDSSSSPIVKKNSTLNDVTITMLEEDHEDEPRSRRGCRRETEPR